MKKIALLIFVITAFAVSCTYEKADLPPSAPKCDSIVHFSSTILSIVNTSCQPGHGGSGCHEPGSSNGDYTNYSVMQAKVASGALLNRVYTLKNMPAAGGLSDADRLRIYCWIQQGGPNN